jgi:hypothetical protein
MCSVGSGMVLVCKATLPSESGSEALLVSTSPEHREMACPTRVPVGSPRKSAAIIPFVNRSLTSGLGASSLFPRRSSPRSSMGQR